MFVLGFCTRRWWHLLTQCVVHPQPFLTSWQESFVSKKVALQMKIGIGLWYYIVKKNDICFATLEREFCIFIYFPMRQIWSNQISIKKSWLKVDGLLLCCGFTSLWASESESLGGEGELKSAEDFLLSLEKEKWEYWCGAQSCPSGCFSWQMSCNEWEVTGQSFVRDV